MNSYRFRIFVGGNPNIGCCWPMGCRLMGWPMGYWCSSIILISVWTILTSAYYTRHFHSTVHWSMILTFHGRIYYCFCCITIIYDVVYDLVVYAITVKLVIILMSRSGGGGVRFHVDIWGHCRGHGCGHPRQVGGWRWRGWWNWVYWNRMSSL